MLKKGLIILTMAIFLLSLFQHDAAVAKGMKWDQIKNVKNGDAKTILVKGKKRMYYGLTTEYKSSITVEGPAQILIRSRLIMAADAKGDHRYQLSYKDQNGAEKSFTEKTRRSTRAKFANKKGQALGSSMIYEFDVPAGKHTFSFRMKEGACVARFYKRPKPEKISWKPIELTLAESETYIVQKNNAFLYYPVKMDKALTFSVIGPTKLKIMTRLDFTEKMAGEQRYSLIIKHNNDKPQKRSFSTKKSKKYIYANQENALPGVAKYEVIDVPAGKQSYSINLTGGQAKGGSIRILKAESKK